MELTFYIVIWANTLGSVTGIIIIIIIIIVFIIFLVITFMQGIYNCIPETNHISRVYCSCSVFTVRATCNVMSTVKYVLYFYIIALCSMCAVPTMAVFCSSLILCFPGMLLRYCLNGFEMVPVAPVITGITCVYYYYYYYLYARYLQFIAETDHVSRVNTVLQLHNLCYNYYYYYHHHHHHHHHHLLYVGYLYL